uniref:Uncharacterized protein n=1 Tax=Avena sativa TaxID=4498 RepID=A0ACD5XIU0_AVESA
MALTAFQTAEQRLPCHVDQPADDGRKVVAAEQAVPLQEADHGGADQQRPAERDDIWNMIQSQKPAAAAAALAPKQQAPYVPVRRSSSSLLTQKSLEICTESLGSETGSDGFSDADRSCPGSDDDDDADAEGGADGVANARAPPPRAFPPPLPSLARRTVGSLQMRQHRRDGRLVVEAVPVLSNTLFRAQRRGGRLLLSFADTAAPPASDEEKNSLDDQEEPGQQEADEQAQDEEEEVQVVDRGTVVEVKVSTQPQAHNSGARVHRSSLVINKFVGAEPVNTVVETNDTAVAPPKPSALSATAPLPEDYGTTAPPGEGKVLMTTRQRRSKQEVLNHMRRCGQLSGRLFIWEPRVATSS